MGLTAPEATAIARSVVVSLCGGRWTSPPVTMVDEYPVSSQGRVILSGRPVIAINSVRLGGELLDPADYRVYNGFVLALLGAPLAQAKCRPATVEVDYQYGLERLPAAIETAIDVLASEMGRCDNDANCRIPDRVTSVTRQGMSWTLIDPQDFLTDGRTGIYEVDLAIKAYNPKNARRRARVFHHRTSAPALRRKP